MTATTAEYDAYFQQLRAANVGPEAAEREARRAYPRAGVAVPEIDDGALEDVHVAEADKFMRALGFEVVSFSQKKRAKVTPGIPDRRYYRRPRVVGRAKMPNGQVDEVKRAVVLWWEAKSATGRQRPDQKLFQEMAEACGETYVLGTHEALMTWLIDNRIAVRVGNQLEPVPYEVSRG